MRFAVTHSTTYRYSEPVMLEPHIIRLRPRADATQKLLAFNLQITPPPAGRSNCLDIEGNSVVQAWFDAPISELNVTSSFEVETLRVNPYDFLLPPPDQLVLKPAVSTSEKVRGIAAWISQSAGGQTMAFLDQLTERLFRDFHQAIREEGDPHEPEVTLSSREVSCRDLAVLFCAVCQSVGLRARFVSGYEVAAAQADHRYMHAWAEVCVPGGGWRGYDPSRGVPVSTNHVAVAAAAEPPNAAPVVGSYRGSAESTMQVVITMEVG